MGLFSRYKDLKEYKVLEVVNLKRTPIGINGASGSKCTVLYEDDNYKYLICTVQRLQDPSYYLLRMEKNKNDRVIFLGSVLELSCYCEGKVFYVYPYAIPMHNHTMVMIDCMTGVSQEVNFLNKEEILGLKTDVCLDIIIDISASHNNINLLVLRDKQDNIGVASSSLNEDLIYQIEVVYQNGVITPKPVTLDSILVRGPWRRPEIQLPSGTLTAAEIEMYYRQYGKEAVDDALLYKAMRDDL